MRFRRSDAGVTNYSHFLKVDYVAYVEGKTDIGYWQTMFSVFRPNMKIRFEKRDGIDNMSSIVDSIIHGRIGNVFVCRDADYRPLLGTDQIHDRLLRTHGYSFENDFFTEEAAAAVACLIAPRPMEERFLKRAFRRYFTKLSKIGEVLLRLDVSFVAMGDGMISRKNPKDLMTGDQKNGFAFSTLDAKHRYRMRRQAGPRGEIDFGPHGNIFPRYYCGHSVWFVLLAWSRSVVERRAGRPQNASNSVIKNHLLSHYEMLVSPATRNFMANQLGRL